MVAGRVGSLGAWDCVAVLATIKDAPLRYAPVEGDVRRLDIIIGTLVRRASGLTLSV